jgi:hypothetical protein
MTLDEVVPLLQKYPGMFCLNGNFASIAAFLQGFNTATDQHALSGFREMLANKVGTGDNMAWEYLVLRLAFPDEPRLWDTDQLRSESEEEIVKDLLFSLLVELSNLRAG